MISFRTLSDRLFLGGNHIKDAEKMQFWDFFFGFFGQRDKGYDMKKANRGVKAAK